MSDDKKAPEVRPMHRSAKADQGDGPRTSTITFDPDNLDSVNAAMRVLKQARADIEARERAEAEAAEKAAKK